MYYALLYFPGIEHKGFQDFRHSHEPYANLCEAHIPFIFPLPSEIGLETLSNHIENIIRSWNPFRIHIRGHEKTWDHWLMLSIRTGNDSIHKLHDELYSGILKPHLREDLPFIPHIGVGFFGKESYDFHNPTAVLSLDENRYQRALMELEALKLNFWRTIDCLTLVQINPEFTVCKTVKKFPL